MQYLYVDEDFTASVVNEGDVCNAEYGTFLRVSFRLVKGVPTAITLTEQYIDSEWVTVL